MNSIYSAFNNQQQRNIMQDFMSFKRQMGNIDPKREVMKCIQNGFTSQSQINDILSKASQMK